MSHRFIRNLLFPHQSIYLSTLKKGHTPRTINLALFTLLLVIFQSCFCLQAALVPVHSSTVLTINSQRLELIRIYHALYNLFKPIRKISRVSKHSIVVGADLVKRVRDLEISVVACGLFFFASLWVGVVYGREQSWIYKSAECSTSVDAILT